MKERSIVIVQEYQHICLCISRQFYLPRRLGHTVGIDSFVDGAQYQQKNSFAEGRDRTVGKCETSTSWRPQTIGQTSTSWRFQKIVVKCFPDDRWFFGFRRQEITNLVSVTRLCIKAFPTFLSFFPVFWLLGKPCFIVEKTKKVREETYVRETEEVKSQGEKNRGRR